jgi:hypothetical protein
MKAKAESLLRLKPLRTLAWAGLIGASVSLFRSTLGQATDFLVFWQVGQALHAHQPFYGDNPAAPGMVFKYPPWVALLFYPFGWIDFVTAKGVWALIEVLSLLSILWTLRRSARASPVAILTLFALYWGVWVIHFLDGQIILPILAVFLHFWSRPRMDASARGMIPILMSAKVFTVFPLLATLERFRPKRAIYATIMLGAGLTYGTALLSYEGNVPLMIRQWTRAASSGAQQLNPGQTRGGKNQSLGSWICRTTGVAAEETRAEVILSFALFAVAFIAIRARRSPRWQARLGEWGATDEVLCLLALTAPLHPLPWHHLYTWTFPLAVVRFDRDRGKLVYWVAIALLTMSSARAIPVAGIGEFLEWNVGRAWGALLLVAQTAWARRRSAELPVQGAPERK